MCIFHSAVYTYMYFKHNAISNYNVQLLLLCTMSLQLPFKHLSLKVSMYFIPDMYYVNDYT